MQWLLLAGSFRWLTHHSIIPPRGRSWLNRASLLAASTPPKLHPFPDPRVDSEKEVRAGSAALLNLYQTLSGGCAAVIQEARAGAGASAQFDGAPPSLEAAGAPYASPEGAEPLCTCSLERH